MFRKKTLMIVGGTGSFGNAVLQHFIESDIGEIRIFSRDEKKQEDLRIKYCSNKLNFMIGDIRDLECITSAMQGVDFVFHAAALKQVPSCEFFPMQAIKTNILGSENVLEAAARNHVKRTVVLSTDKAVYSINTMGMSKAIMEKLAISKARDPRVKAVNATICATRYGNVMASRGSIIPLFIKQIREGSNLTVTEPEMTRFMMSLEQSVELVLYAFEHGHPGDIFVQKAPAATIITLAKALKTIFNADNPIDIIGPRHGEKMHETLCSSEEMARAEELDNYYRVPADMRDLNYTKYLQTDGPRLTGSEYNSETTYRLSQEELIDLLSSLPYVQEQLRQQNQ